MLIFVHGFLFDPKKFVGASSPDSNQVNVHLEGGYVLSHYFDYNIDEFTVIENIKEMVEKELEMQEQTAQAQKTLSSMITCRNKKMDLDGSVADILQSILPRFVRDMYKIPPEEVLWELFTDRAEKIMIALDNNIEKELKSMVSSASSSHNEFDNLGL